MGESGEGEAARWRTLPRRLLPYVGLIIAYVVTGRLGLLLAVPPGYASAIFPPAGIAIGAMLIGGARTLPFTFVGSFALNTWLAYQAEHRLEAIGIAAAAVIAAASASQAAIGGDALRRAIGYPTTLDTIRDLARFLVVSPVCCLTSATISVGGLWGLGVITPANLATSWLAWWIGDTLGVLVMLPLVLVAAGRPRALWRGRAPQVGIPMLLFFALFVAIFTQVSWWERDDSLLEFRIRSQAIADRTKTALEEQMLLLEEVQRAFSGRAVVTRQDFRSLAQPLLHRFPTLQAVEWAPRVAAAQRAAFEAKQREEVPGFEIRELNVTGPPSPVAERAQYYPVTYIEPLEGNQEAVGLDLADNGYRGTALAAAITTERAVATAPIRLVQEHAAQAALLLIVPVAGEANGPGVVLTVVRMGTLIEALLGSFHLMIGARVADLENPWPLYDDAPPGPSAARYEQHFDFAGRHYLFAAVPTQLYLLAHRGWQSWIVLVAGVFSTSLLGVLLLLGSGYRHHVETLVQERTRELEVANEHLHREVRERLDAQAALRQAQKMEAVGELAGGLAHDFNNLLTVILGTAEIVRRRLGERTDPLLDNIVAAGERGVSLTRQLLTFSRRQAVAPQVWSLHRESPRVRGLLKASLRDDIELTMSVPDDIWRMELDPGEIEMALLNLAVNARDSMPEGGRFEITARNVLLRNGEVAQAPHLEGAYVAISLRDGGVGIAPEILPRVFDPFFTTKDVGSGTGLGLSQVYGFCRQSHGAVSIVSEVGVGTEITLYLPRSTKPILGADEVPGVADQAPLGSAHVLLVEDDPTVAETTSMMLQSMGLDVTWLGRARAALDWLAVGARRVDLVLTDIVMPEGMSGIDLARQARHRFPELPIVLMSGHADIELAPDDPEFTILRKPIPFALLEATLRTRLNPATPS
jgi:signal transduction histidine kinase/integral membrane sensor domain MASE1